MFKGLSDAEVKVKQNSYGLNVLPAPKNRFLKLFLRQFKGVFNILLLVAALVTFLLNEPVDASFILLFVVLSVSLSLFQEYKSEAAALKLKSYLVSTITVRRNNKDVEIATKEIVPGDIMKLEVGDVVPADGVVVFAHDFSVDESTFTGENLTTPKYVVEDKVVDANKVLQGVRVVSGSACVEVVATGVHTRFAELAKATQAEKSVSELSKGIDAISGFVLRATSITLVFIVLANVLIEGESADIPHLLVFGIALAISAIPEALPLVMTFSLSRGALRLAKKQVIVKRLSSVQDLGSVDLLCTDKTGTITENKLAYKNDYLIGESPYHPLLWARLASHKLREYHKEPFDLAVDEALSSEDREIFQQFQVLEEEAFDPALRSNGAVVVDQNGNKIHIRRGSPEYFVEAGLVHKDQVATWLEEEERLGHRILGVSYDYGHGARFGGFVAFSDSVKSTTKATLEAAKKLNVAITVITGDSFLVAKAVGQEVGLINDDSEVIEASRFFALSYTEQRKLMGKIRVFARTTPEQKLTLIQLLKEKYTVGFLGEGINDAPALKASHVAMVVQSASDVARETADIILLKSNLGVIVEGIRLGRETHANTLKYIRATLVSNFGNFYAVAIGSLFISFLPMLPKQILLLNLLSDLPMIAIAFDRVSNKEVSRPQRYNFKSLYIIFITLGLVSTVFDFMWFALFYQISPGVLQTNWFIASAITEILLLFSIRSMLPIRESGRPAPILIYLSVGAVGLAVLLPIIPVTAAFFSFTTPSAGHLTLILALSLLYVVVSEMVKRPVARFIKAT